jgi:hypothetical protein
MILSKVFHKHRIFNLTLSSANQKIYICSAALNSKGLKFEG